MSALVSLALEWWPAIALAIGAVFGGFKLYGAGKKSERAKQDRARVEAIEEANQIQNEVGALPSGEAREELRKWAR